MTTQTVSALTAANATPKVRYTIVDVEGHDDCSCRLQEMGVSQGTHLTIERSGNPAVVRIGTSKFALSRDCLSRIIISPIQA